MHPQCLWIELKGHKWLLLVGNLMIYNHIQEGAAWGNLLRMEIWPTRLFIILIYTKTYKTQVLYYSPMITPMMVMKGMVLVFRVYHSNKVILPRS